MPVINELPRLEPSQYDRRRLHRELTADIDALMTIWGMIQTIKRGRDAKVERLKGLLGGELRDQKVLIFTYYKDTAQYLFHALGL